MFFTVIRAPRPEGRFLGSRTGARLFLTLAASLALSACATSKSLTKGPSVTTAAPSDMAAPAPSAVPAGVKERDLTPAEKKIIIAAVAPNLRDPESAKYHWTQFPTAGAGDMNYCATVDAKSPYPPYSGRQDYVVDVTVARGRVTTAAMVLIAGGKDTALVAKECAKYGLNPYGGG